MNTDIQPRKPYYSGFNPCNIPMEKLVSAHKVKQNELNELTNKRDSYLSLSRKINKIFKILVLIFAVVGGFVGWFLYKKWYAVLGGIFGGAVLLYALGGVIFALLKPYLWVLRRKAKKITPNIIKLEDELCLLRIALIDTYTPANKLVDSVSEGENDFSAKKYYSEWKTKEILLLEQKKTLHSLLLNKQRLAEWEWIGGLFVIALIAASIIIAMVTLYLLALFLFVVIVVALAVAVLGGYDERRIPVNNAYDDNDYYSQSNNNSEDEFFDKLFNFLTFGIFSAAEGVNYMYNVIIKEIERLSTAIEHRRTILELNGYCAFLNELE